ncbi:aminotransferase class I/II-fold pyridoxal phosphate-dependent enzyme, partial [Streptococcus pneumoniae]|uniref:aminotransferase class I/II-fold pyridoxal phosphate-dependent enzyme n=1 Tax=Streptococcus pneumoniae TaxID=1313 RepID=UPI0032979058
DLVRGERARLARELGARGFDCLASQTNFLLTTVPGLTAGGAEALYRGLSERGVFVRWFDQERLHDRLRIT